MPLYPPAGGGASTVTLTGTQTLTNKTLTAPAITDPTVTGSGTWTTSGALALGSAKTLYATFENTTAAIAGTQQNSPMVSLSGRGWNGTASEVNRVIMGNYPLADQGAGASEGRLGLWFLNGSGAAGSVPQLAIQYAQASARMEIKAGTGIGLILGDRDLGGAFINLSNTGLTLGGGGSTLYDANGTLFAPRTDVARTLGDSTHRWAESWQRVAVVGDTSGNKPAASSSIRGALFVVQSGAGVGDILQCCMKGTADTYSWVTIATAA